MDPFSCFQIVQGCYLIGQTIVDICHDWKTAHEEVQARVVIVESSWDRSKRQVDFMQKISAIIDDDLFRNLDDLLNQLFMRLSAAQSLIESVTKKESGRWARLRVSRAAYVWKKEALDSVIKDLEEWQKRFDPSWFLIMTIANPIIDKELQRGRATAGATETPRRGPPSAARNPLSVASNMRDVLGPAGNQSRSVFLPECAMDTSVIRFSDANLGRLLTGDLKWYIIDSIACDTGRDVNALTRDVRSLAAKLSQADPFAFGLLNCKGVMRVSGRNPPSRANEQFSELRIVFRIPEGMDALQSLRDLLLTANLRVSLTQRVRIAVELAKSISYVHTFNFVHKNVRPESILCFEDSQKGRSHTFLVGFDAFRAADGSTILHGDTAWERNLYRHPDRQGEYAADRYRMQHDIYSLGVCLLEIGLWESFVDFQINGNFTQAVTGKWYPRFEAWLTSAEAGQVPRAYELPSKVKEYLVEVCRTSLPSQMGEKYAAIVLACLTCLDNKSDHGSRDAEAGAENRGMTVAVEFVEQIVLQLNEITI